MKRLIFSFLTICALAVNAGADTWYSAPLQAQELMFGNAIKWSTIREVNMKEFVLEKSADGVSFDEIATLPATSFSMVDKSYHFMDINPIGEVFYYRLREITETGKYAFSPVIVVEKKLVNDLHMLSMTNVQVSKTFTVKFDALRDMDTKCVLRNFKGDVLDSYTKTMKSGLNDVQLDLQPRAPGIYFFTVSNGDEVEKFTLTRVETEETRRPQVAELGDGKHKN